MSATFKVTGLNKFVRSVSQKPVQVQKAVDQELNRSSLRVERRAKKYAAWDTGWMSNTIYSSFVSTLLYEIVSPADYSIYIEEGTRYMMAQPFMRPALKEEEPILFRNLRKIVGA